MEGYDPEAIRKEFDDTGGMTWEEKLRAARSKINQEKNTVAKIRFNNSAKYGKIIIDGDVFVPCLKDASTGQIVETVVEEADRKTLKRYNKKQDGTSTGAKSQRKPPSTN